MRWWPRTFLLGFGMFGISAVWPIYDFFMPLFYAQFVASGTVIGAIMALDNVAGLTLQPYFGALSDRTHSRFGRRVPYVLAGAPAAALCLAALPMARAGGFVPLLLVTIAFNIAMAVFRSPTLALMPDLVPGASRSVANGIMNFMGGLGAAVSLLVAGALFSRSAYYPFLLSASLLLLVTLIIGWWVRDPHAAADRPAAGGSPWQVATALLRAGAAGTRLLLAATFLWSLAFQAGNSWFSTYATGTLGLSVPAATRSLFLFVVTYVATAIPAGIVGTWAGRRPTLIGGALIMAAGQMMLAGAAFGFPVSIAMFTAAAGWSLLAVNSYPMLLEAAGDADYGTYTGLYFLALQAGAMVAPPLLGWVKDMAGWTAFFGMTAAILVGCGLAVFGVRRAKVQFVPVRGLR